MKLHPPFMISSRLAPALRIGDYWDGEKVVPGTAWLSMVKTEPGDERRTRYTFVIDGITSRVKGRTSMYQDRSTQSGNGGRTLVEAFDNFLGFLLAAVESREYRERTGRQGENEDLFPKWVVEWAADNKSALEYLQCELQDEDGRPRQELIEP